MLLLLNPLDCQKQKWKGIEKRYKLDHVAGDY